MNPKLSIIIPVYNVEKYLNNCLQSVCQPGNVEILCIEDGSTDNSLDILKEWENKDKRITVIQHNKNKGLSAARNTGLLHAKGDYIWCVDSDDMIIKGSYNIILKHVEKDNLDVLRFNGKMLVSENIKGKTKMLATWWSTPAIYEPCISGRKMFSDQKVNKHYRQPVQIYAIKRQFLMDNNLKFQEGIYFEDELFTLSVLMKAKRTSDINDILYLYFVRENSITTMEKNKKHFDSLVFIIDEIFKKIYTDEPEMLKRMICRHLSFLFEELNKTYQIVKDEVVLNEYEKEIIEVSSYVPPLMRMYSIENLAHKRHN